MNEFENGSEVLIRATIDRVPQEGQELYRVITPSGSIVWVRAEEMEPVGAKA